MKYLQLQSEGLLGLVDPTENITQVATGFEFTEGPIWLPDGSLHFSDMPADKRRRWHPDDGASIVRDPSNKCNGMTLDLDGGLVVCEHSTSSVIRELGDGTRVTLASHWQGKELNSPNDVVVTRDGSVLFTDPTYGRMPVFGVPREPELAIRGVYRVRPDTGDLQLLVDDFEQPNGLCLSPDESLLYIDDTVRAHVRVFEVGSEMSLHKGRIFAENISVDEECSDGLVDGMKVDELGNLYVTGPGGIWVFSPDGTRLGSLLVPEQVSNMNWGDQDWSTLYVTASTSVYRIRMKVSGNRLHYMN